MTNGLSDPSQLCNVRSFAGVHDLRTSNAGNAPATHPMPNMAWIACNNISNTVGSKDQCISIAICEKGRNDAMYTQGRVCHVT